ncbi:MAG TPA: hypothetical protein VFA58_05855 [Chthoniobacterales bacterium]|nr:hypothetical protein [Chthoniobacterales bacterium]
MRVPSPFESFNARPLSAEVVASTFIPSDNFSNVAIRAHSIVAGPRGSGKTSLLKMLQTRALEVWKHPEAELYRDRVDYTGVFIPTDIAWEDQLKNLGFRHLEETERQQLCVAAFSAHVFHAIIGAFINRLDRFYPGNGVPHRRVRLTENDETTIVKEIAGNNHLTPSVNSLRALKYAVRARIGEIWEIATREINCESATRSKRFAQLPFLSFHFLKQAGFAVEVFNDAIGDPEGRWALLFDELEIAPPFILQQLLKAFRSVDEHLLIKVSLSPYSAELDEFRKSLRATGGQDYNEISLSHSHKERGYEFGRQLLESLISDEGFSSKSLEEVFGTSPFEQDSQKAYRAGSIQYKTIEKALDSDSEFRAYFQQRNLSLDKLADMSGLDRAKNVRKLFPTLLLRQFFRTHPIQGVQKRQKKRSRKNPTIYGGATGLLAVSEGNPRWLIGMARPLLAQFRHSGRVPIRAQTEQMLRAADRFRAVLKLIPVQKSARYPNETVLGIIDRIAAFFHDSVMGSFRPQPYGCFTIDKDTDPGVVAALGLALNAGGIVFVPRTKSAALLGHLVGERFRLSYLLSMYYEIPIRLGAEVPLSRILRGEREEIPSQPTLL